MTPAANLVDAASPGRVLVFGSPPRSGCDLDLLVRKDELTPIAQALAGAGFRSRDQEWVRFRESTAEAVDLVPATDWSLPQHELDDLFARARPLDGFERLVAPSPEHVLLVLARITGGSALSQKRRERIDRALADEPDVWSLARARAGAWGLRSELDRLERAYRGEPARGLRPPRPRRPRVVALSGIDGSGKSSQAGALRAALEQLGHETAVEWSPYGQDAWLNHIAVPVKRLLGRSDSFRPDESAETGLERTSGTVLRERSPVVNQVWSTVVTFANGLSQLRTIAWHTRHGRVVVYDRYALDSTVQLRFRYGPTGRFSFQRRLIDLLTPKPVAAFYLDIPPETSLRRKDDRWTLEDLSTQADLYREEYERRGVVRLDGLRPADELAAEIGEAVWRALD